LAIALATARGTQLRPQHSESQGNPCDERKRRKRIEKATANGIGGWAASDGNERRFELL